MSLIKFFLSFFFFLNCLLLSTQLLSSIRIQSEQLLVTIFFPCMELRFYFCEDVLSYRVFFWYCATVPFTF